MAHDQARLPIAYRLYWPSDWAADQDRRYQAGVPDQLQFQSQREIALDQIRQATQEGAPPPGTVLADPAYGNRFSCGCELTGLGLR
jgi:SRSO17 transposase